MTGAISASNLPAAWAAENRCCERSAQASWSCTRDLVLRDEILGVPAGMLAGEGVVEPVVQHRVVDLGIAHAVAPAAAVHQVRRGIHVLHAAGDRGVDEAEHDLGWPPWRSPARPSRRRG